MVKWFKNLLKDRLMIFKIRDRFNAAVQIQQRQLYHYYADCARNNQLSGIGNAGFRVFSQFEEDGKLLYIFSVLGMNHKTFVEIGSDDGINSNCANLAFNFGWHGLYIDGNAKGIERGKKFYARYPHPFSHSPKFICAKVTRENINELVKQGGLNGDIGLLSVDIDGNDYWVWDALEIVQPQVVIIETHIEFGYNNIVVPYDANYMYPGKHPEYHGASPVAMVNLGKKKGYRLVGANELGFNFIFIKNGLADELIPEVSIESVLQHPSVIESFTKFEAVKDYEYIQG